MSIKKEAEKLAAKLHPLERKVLPLIAKAKNFSDLSKLSKLIEIEVMRALQWLQNKDIIKLNQEVKDLVELGKNGKDALKRGLPEKRFLSALSSSSSVSNDDLKKKADLIPEEFGVSMGLLKKNSCLLMTKEGIKKTPAEKFFIEKLQKVEDFLKKSFPIDLDDLSEDEKSIFQELKKRKDMLAVSKKKTITFSLTDKGKNLIKLDLSKKTIERLTPELIKSGKYKNKTFRSYDIKINVPRIYGGKKHFVNEAIDYIKQIWLDLGFKEMSGNLIQTSFWDLDSLFVPQDHPAREMQDTYYIKNPKFGKLPLALLKKIKAVHENGGNTGSKGWQSAWSEQLAGTNLLRTHTTVLSAQTINRLKKEDMPAKFFSVAKVFRNEALDWKHLFEFYQVEGIVVDPNANLRNLLGYLKEFFKKMGYKDVRIRPAHFPYTEPSCEVEVLHPVHNEWIELGGAGIFRPEVTKPLIGTEVPVLAWGMGMERIISEYYAITDIRDLYKNDLKQIREMKAWLR